MDRSYIKTSFNSYHLTAQFPSALIISFNMLFVTLYFYLRNNGARISIRIKNKFNVPQKYMIQQSDIRLLLLLPFQFHHQFLIQSHHIRIFILTIRRWQLALKRRKKIPLRSAMEEIFTIRYDNNYLVSDRKKEVKKTGCGLCF